MTVLFLDAANGNDVATKWTTGTPASTQSGVSPTGRNAYRYGNTAGQQNSQTIPDTTSVLAGWKGRLNVLSTDGNSGNETFRIQSDSGATIHLSLGVTSAGAVTVRRGAGNGTLLATSSNGVISTDTWHHYEFRATLNDSTGRAQVWVDGVLVIDFTGDTKNAGTKTDIDTVRWGRTGTNGTNWDCCDFSICDSTTNNGVTQVADSLPTGNGNSSGLTGSDGNSTDNYLLADEATPNGDTDYNIGDAEGEKDTYAMANLPSGTWDVLAIQVNNYARKADAGTRFMRPVIRTGGADFAGTSVAMSESYDTYWQVWNTNPNTTNPWTQSEVDGIEVGAEARDS